MGQSFVNAQRLTSREGLNASVPNDASLDLSGWTPGALQPLLRLASRLPFEEAAETAGEFGLKVSKSELERLTQLYGRACREGVYRLLHEAEEPTQKGGGRLMVLEVDGVRVLGQPQEGACSGIEIKNIALYPAFSPGQRWLLSDVRDAKELPELVQGLLKRALLPRTRSSAWETARPGSKTCSTASAR